MLNFRFRLTFLHRTHSVLIAAAAMLSAITVTAQSPNMEPARVDQPGIMPQAEANPLGLAPGEVLENPESLPSELRSDYSPALPEAGSCSSCNSGSCNGGNCNGAMSYGGFGNACGGCEPGYYLRVESLFMVNENTNGVTLSRDFALGDFDYEPGARIAIGRLFDCVHGYEAVLTGFLEWDLTDSRQDAGGALDSLLVPIAPILGPDIDTFTNGTLHTQSYQATYNSLATNRTYRGWDVANKIIGVRLINYNEEYLYSVTNNVPESGSLRHDVDNQLIGIHTGIDLAYPLSERIWSTLRTRIGGFINFVDSQTQVINNGVTIVNNRDDDKVLSGLLELGAGLRYDFRSGFSVHAGYELWYMVNVATAVDQINTGVSSTLGSTVRVDDNIFIHGLTFGAELQF